MVSTINAVAKEHNKVFFKESCSQEKRRRERLSDPETELEGNFSGHFRSMTNYNSLRHVVITSQGPSLSYSKTKNWQLWAELKPSSTMPNFHIRAVFFVRDSIILKVNKLNLFHSILY